MKGRKKVVKNPNVRAEIAKRRATPTQKLPDDDSDRMTPASQAVDTAQHADEAVSPSQPEVPKVQSTAVLPSRTRRRAGRRILKVALWILGVLAALALIAGAGWFYLDMRDTENAAFVPMGVTLDDSSLAGMDRAAVTEVVQALIDERFATSLTLEVGDEPVIFEVGAFASSDPDTLVDEIMQVRLDTPLWDRLKHDYLDEPIVAAFESSYLVDTAAIHELARNVSDQYSYAATDAHIYFEGFTPHISESAPGLYVDPEQTAASIEALVLDSLAGLSKTKTSAFSETTAPTVTREDLMIPVLTVNIGARQVMLWSGDQLQLTYPCAVGQPAYPTIPGEYYIGAKEVNPTWYNPAPDTWGKGAPKKIPGPNDALGARGMHIYTLEGYDTQMLFHGALAGGLAGTATTHGCIRMFNYDVIDLYERVPVGTPVSLSY